MGACPRILTERLVLRPFTSSDLDPYLAILRHPEVRASLHIEHEPTRQDAFAQVTSFLGQWELRGTGQWAVEERGTGRFLGRAGTHRPEHEGWPGVEVGWTLHPDVWGHGYATEAGHAAVDYAFSHLRVDALFSLILEENVRSQAVAQRLGFTLTGYHQFAWFTEAPHGIWRLARADAPVPAGGVR